MSSNVRHLLLICALKTRRAVQSGVETARYIVATVRYLRPRPSLRVMARFCRACSLSAPTPPPTTTPTTAPPLTSCGVRKPERGVERVIVSNPPAAAPTLLGDVRTIRLQRVVLQYVFGGECALRLRERDITVLCVCASSAWLRHNLFNAAGCGSGKVFSREEFQERCRVVFPVFVQAMRMHLRYLRGRSTELILPRILPRWRIRSLRRRHRVGANGEILDSLYPRSVVQERKRQQNVMIRRETSRRYRTARKHALLFRFDRYLNAVSMMGDSGVTSPARAGRALRAFDRIFNSGGGHYGRMDQRTERRDHKRGGAAEVHPERSYG